MVQCGRGLGLRPRNAPLPVLDHVVSNSEHAPLSNPPSGAQSGFTVSIMLACGASLLEILKRAYNPEGWRSEMVRATVIAGFLLTLAVSCLAEEHQHGNGEKLGAVHFATSCNEAVQKVFNRAALLHSFQFSRAIEGFNAVLGKDATSKIDPGGCAGPRTL
jgi:hypothetical protein